MKNSILKVLSVLFCMILVLSLIIIPASADTPSLENYRYKTTIQLDYPYGSKPTDIDFPRSVRLDDNTYAPLYYVVVDPDGSYAGPVDMGLCTATMSASSETAVTLKFSSADRTATHDMRIIFDSGDYTVHYNGDEVFAYDSNVEFELYSLDNNFLPYVDTTHEWYTIVSIEENFPPVNETMTDKWTDIMTWVTDSLGSVQSVFFADGELTFMGTLAVVGVAIAVAFLIIGVVQKFLTMRG